jgi:hypothetical protein
VRHGRVGGENGRGDIHLVPNSYIAPRVPNSTAVCVCIYIYMFVCIYITLYIDIYLYSIEYT